MVPPNEDKTGIEYKLPTTHEYHMIIGVLGTVECRRRARNMGTFKKPPDYWFPAAILNQCHNILTARRDMLPARISFMHELISIENLFDGAYRGWFPTRGDEIVTRPRDRSFYTVMGILLAVDNRRRLAKLPIVAPEGDRRFPSYLFKLIQDNLRADRPELSPRKTFGDELYMITSMCNDIYAYCVTRQNATQ